MFDTNINLNFRDLIKNYKEVIKYLSRNSDSFSLISNLKKPFSKQPPNFEHDKAMKSLEPYVEHFFVGIKKWPGTITKDNHKIMIVYRSCTESRKLLVEMPNLFLPIENGLPEDICFLKNQKPWFATTSHEYTAFVISATETDINFFKKNDIRIIT